MRMAAHDSALRQMDRLLRIGPAPSGDRALLERFLERRDEAAFEALVNRHGPMVRGVCLRLLGPSDADDAFQATFLVLVRKAAHLRDADRLGPWLHGVAVRVAGKARARSYRHSSRHEPFLDDPPSKGGTDPSEGIDLRAVLDDELGRLPSKHREVLVLCLLEGSTAEEAAPRLGCPAGTVKSRLARGRERLRARLVARGLAPTAALAAVEWSARPSHASPVPEALIRAASRSAMAADPASAFGPSVASLARGAAPTMISKTTVLATFALGGLTLSTVGFAFLGRPLARAQEPAPPRPDATAAKTEALRRTVNDLKQIGLAMHSYLSANDFFPPAAITSDDGRPLLSWRVAILPYIEQDALYNAFHKDEPWDSPHNLELARQMPPLYAAPLAPSPAGQTRLRVYHGPKALFDGAKGARLQDNIDGTSNTLLVGVSDQPVPWTKPDEMAFDPDAVPPALKEVNGAVLYLMADGAVLAHDTDAPDWPRTLSALITRAGGEILSEAQRGFVPALPGPGFVAPQPVAREGAVPVQEKAATPPTRVMIDRGDGKVVAIDPRELPPGLLVERLPATPAEPRNVGGGRPPVVAALPADLEARLQAMERKLDLILQKLDTQRPPDGGAAPARR